MKSLTYIEIDVPNWANSSPEELVTYRFAQPTAYLPKDIEAIPSITGVSFSPACISLGENLGERASLTISFKDHKHIFDTESFDSGTFWGKWRARYGTKLRGRSIRWLQGHLGDAIGDFETRHFIIDSTDGPSPDGSYSITAKDILKLADNERAQAPTLSNGFIVSNIDADDTSATLSPTGIGDLEYPASGYVAIGGSEICAFTRSGNTLTLTRGQLNTTATTHQSGERAQLVLQYTAEDPADIISDLLQTYAGISSTYIPIAAWKSETENFLQTLYSATISEPTSVKTLISELIEQAAIAVWWEPLIPQIRLKVLRKIPTDAETYDEKNTLVGTLSTQEQADSRVSQVWTYFGQRNSLRPVSEADNYRSVALTANLQKETEYGGAIIKKIFSRWIPFGARSVALRLNDLILARFADPPRACSFSLWRHGSENPMLGSGYRLGSWSFQNIDGTATTMPIQITRLNPTQEAYNIEAEEMLAAEIAPTDLTNRTIIIDGSINDVNLKTLHDSIYPEVVGDESPAVSLKVYIEESVIVGSSSAGTPAFTVGDFPAGMTITIYVRGRIQGAGGQGGPINEYDNSGGDGGTAIYTRHAVNLILNEGSAQVWGGGGGGGTSSFYWWGVYELYPGGGGSGTIPGSGGVGYDQHDEPLYANAGTSELGGDGYHGVDDGGYGGDPGLAGGTGTGPGLGVGIGGAAGNAIDGLSYITKTGTGDVRGGQVN